MNRRLAAAAVAVLLIAACGGIPKTPPTYIVELAQSFGGHFVLFAYDETGLVTSIASEVAEEAASDTQAIAEPERNQIALFWTGGSCSHNPKLAVAGSASALRLDLDISPLDPSLVPIDCDAIALRFYVTLTLTEPVQQNALTLTLLSR